MGFPRAGRAAPKEFPESFTLGKSLGLRVYFTIYPDSSHNTDTILWSAEEGNGSAIAEGGKAFLFLSITDHGKTWAVLKTLGLDGHMCHVGLCLSTI